MGNLGFSLPRFTSESTKFDSLSYGGFFCSFFFGAPKKHLWDGFRITFYEPCHTQVLTTNCFQCHHKKASPQPPTDFMRIQGHQ